MPGSALRSASLAVFRSSFSTFLEAFFSAGAVFARATEGAANARATAMAMARRSLIMSDLQGSGDAAQFLAWGRERVAASRRRACALLAGSRYSSDDAQRATRSIALW